MAKGTGNFGAYIGAQPIRANMDFGSDAEQQGFRYRREKREKEERNYRRTKENQLEVENMQVELVRSANEYMQDQNTKIFDRGGQLLDEAKQNYIDSGNYADKQKAQNIVDSVQKIKGMQENIGLLAQRAIDLKQTDTYDGYHNRPYENFSKALMEKDFEMDYDKKGRAILKIKSTGEIVDDASTMLGTNGMDVRERFQSEPVLAEMKKKYGTEKVTDEVTGRSEYISTMNKGLSQGSQRAIKNDIDDIFGGTIDTMTDEFKSYAFNDLNIEPDDMSQADFDIIKERFYQEASAMWDIEKSDTFDSAGEDRDQSRWQQNDQFKKRLASAPKGGAKGFERQQKANWLLTTTLGLLDGDQQIQGAVVGSVVGEKIDEDSNKKVPITIQNVEYVDDGLDILLDDGTVRQFRGIEENYDKFKGEIAQFINFGSTTSETEGLLGEGSQERELGETVTTKKYTTQELKDAVSKGRKNSDWTWHSDGYGIKNELNSMFAESLNSADSPLVSIQNNEGNNGKNVISVSFADENGNLKTKDFNQKDDAEVDEMIDFLNNLGTSSTYIPPKTSETMERGSKGTQNQGIASKYNTSKN